MMKNRAVFALLALLVGAMASACTTSYWELDQHSGHPRHTLGWSPKGHVVFSHGHGDAAYAGGRSIYAVRDDGSLLSVIQESGQGRVVTNISPEVSPDGSEMLTRGTKKANGADLEGIIGMFSRLESTALTRAGLLVARARTQTLSGPRTASVSYSVPIARPARMTALCAL